MIAYQTQCDQTVGILHCYRFSPLSSMATITYRPQTPTHPPTLEWRHNGHVCVSNHQPHHCLLNRLFGCKSKKTPKLRVTRLCVGNSPGTGEFPAQMARNAENVSIWWRHHDLLFLELHTWRRQAMGTFSVSGKGSFPTQMASNPKLSCFICWRHNELDGVSKHQPHDCLHKRLFRRRSKKTSKLRVTGHCAGNSPVTGEFPAQRASNAENVSIWWRRHKSADVLLHSDLCQLLSYNWRFHSIRFKFLHVYFPLLLAIICVTNWASVWISYKPLIYFS